jgi:hypothetical protein
MQFRAAASFGAWQAAQIIGTRAMIRPSPAADADRHSLIS